MRSGFRLGVALLLALLAGPALAERIELESGPVGLRAESGPKIDLHTAKDVLEESRRAYEEITDELGLDAGHVFHLHRRPPFWMRVVDRRTPRIWVHLEDRSRILDRGVEAYLERARRGLLRIFVPAPEGDLGPDDVHRLWREMARAILAQTTWRALPLWLRAGIAESLAGRACDDAHALVAVMKEELVSLGDALPVVAVLGATDRSAWARRSGRAVSWALVRLLEEADPRIVPHLYTQVRMLLVHLASYPDELTVIREQVELVRDQLEANGAAPEALARALTVWVEDGFPTGRAFRACEACRILAKARPPELYRIGLGARFGRTVTGSTGTGVLRQNKDVWGVAAWRLPWPTTMEAWIGVRGHERRPDPDRVEPGFALAYPSWSAGKTGRRRLRRRTMSIVGRDRRFGFAWLGVTSPSGVRYLYEYEIRLK